MKTTHVPSPISSLGEKISGRPEVPGLEGLLEVIVGLAASWAGLTLVFSPDGSASSLSVALLEGSGFHDFLGPGLMLTVGVGGLNLVAAALNMRANRFAGIASLFAGASLMTFIATAVFLIPVHHPMQVLFFALGAAIAAFSFRRAE